MYRSVLFFLLIIIHSAGLYAQIVEGSGYLLGDYVEIGINPNGYEGANGSLDEDHARYGLADDSRLGLVANPQMDDWVEYNGDYFFPGSPQNAFALQIDGTDYVNTSLGYTPGVEGEIIAYTDADSCLSLEWEGEVEGVVMNIKYKLIKGALFYTTEIELTNTNPVALNNVYYLRTIEPDNNFELLGAPLGYNTNNSVVSQSDIFCKKALVTAEQTEPWDSYIGFCGVGSNFRCARGGFYVTNGSYVWNGTGGQTGEIGTDIGYDQAISLAYKIATFGAGESETFEFATVFTEASVGDALNNLFKITYDAGEGVGTASCNHLIDTVRVGCEGGNDVTLSIEGADAASYDWVWSPATYLDGTSGESVVSTPADTIVYTVTGTPVIDCLDHVITKSIVVIPTGVPPSISITDPGLQCDEFDLTTLEFVDENEIPLTVSRFFTEIPDSANQVAPLFEGDILTEDDIVYLMIGDTINGCYDWAEIEIEFTYSVDAGADSTITVCAYPDSILSITNLIDLDADLGGSLIENTLSEQFNEETGELEITDLEGIYTFSYTVLATEPCTNDTALYTVVVHSMPEVTISDDVTIASGETTVLTGGGGETYVWTPTTGLSDPSASSTEASPTETTTYTLTVTTENGCTDSEEVTVIIDGQVGINDYADNKISVYPNPFTDFTIVQFDNSLKSQYLIIVTDVLGREVYRNENITDSKVKMRKEELGTGFFLLTIFDEKDKHQVFVEKLLIE